jgi:hypothetical protein
MLQVANVHHLPQGDTFTGFAGLLAQQTVQVDGSPGGLFGAPKRLRKVGVIGCQSIDKLLDILAQCGRETAP